MRAPHQHINKTCKHMSDYLSPISAQQHQTLHCSREVDSPDVPQQPLPGPELALPVQQVWHVSILRWPQHLPKVVLQLCGSRRAFPVVLSLPGISVGPWHGRHRRCRQGHMPSTVAQDVTVALALTGYTWCGKAICVSRGHCLFPWEARPV